MLEKVSAERLDKGIDIRVVSTWCDFRIELRRDTVPCRFFENGDNLGRLPIESQSDLERAILQYQYLEVNVLESPHHHAIRTVI